MPRSDCRQLAPPHPINRVAAFVRIGWPLSIGIGGRLPSESVAALPRIPHIVIALNAERYPDCDAHGFDYKPAVGISRNVFCKACDQGFNVTPDSPKVYFVQRIGRRPRT